MLGIDDRALRVAWTLFLFGLLVAIVYFLRGTLTIFAFAIFFAYILSPIVGLVERLLPQRRNTALAVVYTLLVGILVLTGFELVPAIGSEAASLAKQLPGLFNPDKLASLPLPRFLKPFQDQIIGNLSSYTQDLQAHILSLVQLAGSHVLSGIGALLPVILVPILAFFFLKDAESISVSLTAAFHDGHGRNLFRQVLDGIHNVLKNYVRALVLLSVAAFICWVSFLTIMKYPYELLLAGCAAIGEFIPVIGPISALAVMLIVCIATSSGGLIWLILFWVLYRMFADYVLNPYLMSSGIELHPLLILFGVLAGDSLAGVSGMFFSIPVMAILRVLYLNMQRAHFQKQLSDGVDTPMKIAVVGTVPDDMTAEPPRA